MGRLEPALPSSSCLNAGRHQGLGSGLLITARVRRSLEQPSVPPFALLHLAPVAGAVTCDAQKAIRPRTWTSLGGAGALRVDRAPGHPSGSIFDVATVASASKP
jgi:hypothetical protein